jgi:excisionase family DNA binding protein
MSLLSINEVAEKLNVSYKTVHRWCDKRLIPYYNLNGIRKFDEGKIEEWIKRREVKIKAVV